jgi:esterase/lipase superfamily enzyme
VLALGAIPGLPDTTLDPDLVLVLFLPPLLYSSAFFVSLRDLRADPRPISAPTAGVARRAVRRRHRDAAVVRHRDRRTSMGGFGALSYAARHPGLFRAAASYSGVVHPLGDVQLVQGIAQDQGEDPDALWGDPRGRRAVWAAHDPTEQAARLRGTRLFVSVGKSGFVERRLRRENVALAAALERAGVPATLDFYARGTHDWPYWQRELHRSLPLVLGALAR